MDESEREDGNCLKRLMQAEVIAVSVSEKINIYLRIQIFSEFPHENLLVRRPYFIVYH